MARLLLDEHIMPGVKRRLELLGHTLETVRSTIPGANDDVVLEYARQRRYAVLTKNVRHFKRLHQASADHFGIVACTFNDLGNADSIGRAIHNEIKNLSLRGQFVRVKC